MEQDDQQAELKFSDIGFNSIENAVDVFKSLNVTEVTLKNPIEWQKLKEIASFTNQFSDATSLINGVLARKTTPDVPLIDYVWTYIKLRQECIQKQEQVRRLEQEISIYE